MIIAHNGTCTMHCNLLTDIRVAKETGYEGIEIIGSKLYRYLDMGYTVEDLLSALKGMPPVALGFVQDIERQEPQEYAALLAEGEKMCSLARQLGAPMVQLLTGPLDLEGPYRGLIGTPWPEMLRLTAKNLAVLADIAATYGLRTYLEPLAWSPLRRLDQALQLIDAAGRDNVSLVIDFFHMWAAGATPEQIAKLDQSLIAGVHFCDSLDRTGEQWSPAERETFTGQGRIPLKEWVDAVRATSFDGWWSCELFSPRHWELDPWETARELKDILKALLV